MRCLTLALAAAFVIALAPYSQSQALPADIRAEHDPAKRSELALNYADDAFDSARDFYSKGAIEKGDEQLENMTNALNACLSSLEQAHKAKFYKKAEMKVAFLQRRMSGLLDEVDVQRRGWIEYTDRKLEEIHEKMLNGAMRK